MINQKTLSLNFKGSRSQMLSKKAFLKISQYSQENTCAELLFDKVTGLEVYNFIKERLQHRCFLANIAKFLRKPTLKNICERMLLYF